MNIAGALLLIVLVAVIIAMDVWTSKSMRKLGIRPHKAARGLRVATYSALVLTVAYAIYTIFTRG